VSFLPNLWINSQGLVRHGWSRTEGDKPSLLPEGARDVKNNYNEPRLNSTLIV